jgi:hypothetical protein
MKTEELMDTIRSKNLLIINQTRRISLLENKLDELRKKYFRAKYARILIHLKSSY